ncbi:hypothetical protein MHYP_G00344250 [Metynnis hypsauchen]
MAGFSSDFLQLDEGSRLAVMPQGNGKIEILTRLSLPHAAQSTLPYAEMHTSSEGSGWMPLLALCHHCAQARVKDSRIWHCHQPMFI